MNEVNSMSHKDSGLVLAHSLEHLMENLLLHNGIQGGNRVVHQDDVLVGIYSSCKTESGLLASREVDTFVTNLGHIASRKESKISLQLAGLDRSVVALFIVLLFEEDDISDLGILDPGLLLDIRDVTLHLDGSIFNLVFEDLLCELILEVALVTLSLPGLGDHRLGHICHLTNDCVEKVSLATSNIANDADELPLLDLEVDFLEVNELIDSGRDKQINSLMLSGTSLEA